MADDEKAIVLACTSLVVFMFLHTQILFVPSNEIISINVYFNKLALSRSLCRACTSNRAGVQRVQRVERVVSSVSSRAVRQARHIQNAWARHVERVESCRVVSWRAKWNLGYINLASWSFSGKHPNFGFNITRQLMVMWT